MTRKLILTGSILGIAAIFFWLSGKNLPYLDDTANRYFGETTSEAALAYATVRGVNGVVSVLKESEIELSPAGVGFTIAAGQILDPIDDMTERLSSVLVTALVSLGLQKLVFEIGQAVPLKLAATLLLFLCLPLWLPASARDSFPSSLLLRLCLVFVVLRLTLPFSSQLNETLYRQLLQDEIAAAKETLSSVARDDRKWVLLDTNPQQGLISTLSHSAKEKMSEAKARFTHIAERADDIIEALLQLTTLYVSLFLLQVIVVPIGVLWLLILIVNSLLKTPSNPTPVSRRHRDLAASR